MLIDSYNLIPKTARAFPAIGGGYGVKMKIVGKEEEMLFGQYESKAVAERIVTLANDLKDGSRTTVKFLEDAARCATENKAKVA